jgi:hypothetical protein
MFKLFKGASKIAKAQANLRRQFRIELNDVPEPDYVRHSFGILTDHGSFSEEGNTAVLYSLVVRNFLLDIELKRSAGLQVSLPNVPLLASVHEKATYWAKTASDRDVLDIVLNPLNSEIESLLIANGLHNL